MIEGLAWWRSLKTLRRKESSVKRKLSFSSVSMTSLITLKLRGAAKWRAVVHHLILMTLPSSQRPLFASESSSYLRTNQGGSPRCQLVLICELDYVAKIDRKNKTNKQKQTTLKANKQTNKTTSYQPDREYVLLKLQVLHSLLVI